MRGLHAYRLSIALIAVLAASTFAADPTDVPAMKLSMQPDPEFIAKHNEFLARGKQGPIGMLLLGDSITAGWFWGHDKDIYDAHFGKYQPANFGIGGDRTEHVLWRIEHGELDNIHPKLLLLLIGTNNIGSGAVDMTRGVVAVVNKIRLKLPETKILLLGIFPRGADPKDAATIWMRDQIKTTNASLAKLDDGKMIRYLDLGHLFLSPDGSISKDIMPDALHCNYHGYEVWANAMQPRVDEMMK